MLNKLLLTAIASIVFALPLLPQTAFEHAIARQKGNKIVLLGAQNANEMGKWRQIIDADGIYEHGFALLNRENISGDFGNPGGSNIDAFEAWLRQRYGLSANARWAALNLENNLIVTGVQTPTAKEFEQMLDQRGVKSPLRQVRDFLRENPDHLDAMTDLLKEVRRRALHVMPPNTTEDLGTEIDLRTWGVLAAETDRVFNGNWLGVDLGFFRSDLDQPERFSKLMRASFAKHISKLESALRLDPANTTLWNIWAWMARSMDAYRWENFINSFEPVVFKNDYGIVYSAPSSDVCVWVLEAALAKNDWDTVVKYAKAARLAGVFIMASKTEWLPIGGAMAMMGGRFDGYPEKSAYAPHLEALLRLGDIDAANNVFDELMRLRSSDVPIAYRTGDARIAAEAARSVGMEDLAKLWEKGEHINKAPFAVDKQATGYFSFWVHDVDNTKGYTRQFRALADKLATNFRIAEADLYLGDFGWSSDDDARWALAAEDGRILTQGTAVPDLEGLQAILKRYNILSRIEMYQKYIESHGDAPGLELQIAFEILKQRAAGNTAPLDDDKDGAVLREAAGHFYRALREHPDVLINLPMTYIVYYTDYRFQIKSELMKALSKPMLTNLESLLERKPSSDALWNQWMMWTKIEGAERSIEPIVERVKPSPLAQAGTVPPFSVISAYYEECIKNGNWAKVIGLLKPAWDREYQKVVNPGVSNIRTMTKANIGTDLGIPLIEAYLHDNRFREADEVFNAVLEVGSTFTDISKIVALALEKGQDRLAREWEGRVKK